MISVRVSAIIGLAMIPIGLWITMRAKDEPQQVRHEVVAQVASAASDRRESDPVFHREFTVGAGGNLRVNIPDGDISVRSGSSSRVVIEVFVRSRDADWGREVFERMDFTAGVDGNTVTVAARGADVRRDEWRRNRGVGVTAQITIPARFNAQIETSDGDIRLESLEGNVSLRSSDGDIDIGEVRGQELMVHTSDGDISGGTLQAARMRLRTSDGDINVKRASGDIEANTSDGDIMMRLGAIEGVKVTTHDGDIVLYVPEGFAADVSLEGEDLTVAPGFMLQGQVSSRRISGTLNGGGPRVDARTSDGEISLRIDGR